MTVFKLEKFPHVCRLCLEPDTGGLMFSLDSADPALDWATIRDFLASFTVPIAEDRAPFFPQQVCLTCMELLRFFAKYRSKIVTVHLLMNALVELRHINSRPLVDLFDTKRESVRAVLKDLSICDKPDPTATDLIYEFKQYDIATFSIDVNPELPASEVGTEPANEPSVPEPPRKRPYIKRAKPKAEVENPGEPKKFHCKTEGCIEEFDNLYALRIHRNNTHKPFVCDTCGYRHHSKRHLQIHMERHLQQRDYNCKYCQKTFKTHHDLSVHVREVHIASRKFICGTCGLEFRRKAILQDHELAHGEAYNFTCEICGKKFKRPSALKNHVIKVHETPRHACTRCDKKFHVNYLYLDHVENIHGIKMRFYCDICVQLFFSQETLDAHRVCHSAPKELQCGTCLSVFGSADEMSDHLCITFRDDYVCCGKDLRYYKMYNKHMFIVHGQKTNVRVKADQSQLFGRIRCSRKRIEVCARCEQTFPTRTLKKQHMEICGKDQAESSFATSLLDQI
ncbi:zinc finger imprinted 3-like isoform X1 [Culex pipiens pallens]|uniref:zinc finger imprinted 3-like isoform X1 n=2 Tax=Culex pipiens pallens TaxID=42434 RepID=UPI0022AA2DF4|nr:zinc finger imprinted 3-like isoform X1 [Culex pipiens pallens]